MQRSRLLNIFLVVFIDLLGFGLILPLLPYYAGQYGASSFLIGLLVASYAAAQFIGAPLMGRLSDRFGRRPILVLSIGGTALGFLLLGLAVPLGKALSAFVLDNPTPEQLLALQNGAILGIMFISRMLSGLTGGNITVAQAYIADVTDARNRARGLGLIGAAFGLGFILGPAIGGALSRWGYAVPAFAAAGLATLNLLGVIALLPESLTEERKAELARQKKRALISIPAMIEELAKPRVGPLITVRLFFALASALFQTMFSLWARDRLGLNAQTTSYLLAYVGLLSVIVQGGLIGRLTKRFSEPKLIAWGAVVQGVSLLAWAFTPSVPVLMVVLIPLAFSTGVLNTVINSAITRAVPPHEIGGALGIAGAFESLSRIVSPSAGGWLLGALGPSAPGVAAAAIMLGVIAFAWQRLVFHPDPALVTPG
jgi:DHA1 family tetracycline resistance protein-like MFS transporter